MDAVQNVLLFLNTSISEGIMSFYMPPKIRNSEKDASCLKDVLDFLDLKYYPFRHLSVLIWWIYVLSKIQLPSHVVGVGPNYL